jgi:hypothetical protein
MKMASSWIRVDGTRFAHLTHNKFKNKDCSQFVTHVHLRISYNYGPFTTFTSFLLLYVTVFQKYLNEVKFCTDVYSLLILTSSREKVSVFLLSTFFVTAVYLHKQKTLPTIFLYCLFRATYYT